MLNVILILTIAIYNRTLEGEGGTGEGINAEVKDLNSS